jgi:hypothetical protein
LHRSSTLPVFTEAAISAQPTERKQGYFSLSETRVWHRGKPPYIAQFVKSAGTRVL